MERNLSQHVNSVFEQAEELYKTLMKFKSDKIIASSYNHFFDHRILAAVKEVSGEESKLINIFLKYDIFVLDSVAKRLEFECKYRQSSSNMLIGPLRNFGLLSQLLILLGFFIKWPVNDFNFMLLFAVWILLLVKEIIGFAATANVKEYIFLLRKTILLKEKL